MVVVPWAASMATASKRLKSLYISIGITYDSLCKTMFGIWISFHNARDSLIQSQNLYRVCAKDTSTLL